MYERQTQHSTAVHLTNATACGRILVVDDDRPFGGFMIAALESRGHDVDWAGCIADGLATLYTRRYDLVVIDLRLPDGSGVEFLRHATDQGLLEHSSAVILTGHEFDEPNDIRVFHKTADLDPLLDRMSDIVAGTKRRRGGGRDAAAHRSESGDRNGSARKPRIELVLYTSASSEKCVRALKTVETVLNGYDGSQVRFWVCDLAAHPQHGDADGVVFTPTLVKRGPGPRTWIVGNLDDAEILVDLLDVSGVDRRRA